MPNNNKIISSSQARKLSRRLKQAGKKLVFTNGCFDILHLGHVDLLEKAANFGDVLLVGLNSDESVKKIKGKHRPIVPETDRARILIALQAVAYVVIFNESTPRTVISEIVPDILVKGGDYQPENIVGRNVVEKNGGEVIVVPLLPDHSTTALINKIKKLPGKTS